MKKILFICTGNTCRSPMAEAFMKAILSGDPSLSGCFSAGSAGISAFEGDTASRESISVMLADWGQDMSNHRSKALAEEEISGAFLILTMTENHRNSILSLYPEAAGKTFTLKEYAYDSESGIEPQHCDSNDIPDPYGRSLRYYSECASEIRLAIEQLAEKLKKSR